MSDSNETPATSGAISSKTRSYLRSLAHPLEPLVHVGGDGMTEGILGAVKTALHDHELIKVKLGKSFTGERRPAAAGLAEAVGADLTQLIGRTIVLYRPRPVKEGDKRPRIVVPKSKR